MKLWPCVKLSPVIFGGDFYLRRSLITFVCADKIIPVCSQRDTSICSYFRYISRREGLDAKPWIDLVPLTHYAHREGRCRSFDSFRQYIHTCIPLTDGTVTFPLSFSSLTDRSQHQFLCSASVPGYLSLAGWYIFRYLGTSYCTVQYNGTMRCRCITKMKAIGCIRWMSVILFQVRVH